MQLSITAGQSGRASQVANSFDHSAALTAGFSLRFSRPASLIGQAPAWYRSLDGYAYVPSDPSSVVDTLAAEHRPAIHSCLTYGLKQDYIQESELSALFNSEGGADDAAALTLSSKVMAGISTQLNEYREALTSTVLAISGVEGETRHKEMSELIDWWGSHWLPTLSLSYVEGDFGDYGCNAKIMGLRLVRDHYVAYMSLNVWDAPKPLQPLLILAIQSFSFMAMKPIALCNMEEFCYYEWSEGCDHLYGLVAEEIPYWLEQDDVSASKESLLVMAREQCPSLLEELEEMLYGDYVDSLWSEIIARYRQDVWGEALLLGEQSGHSASESNYLQVVKETLQSWGELQNPMLGHPISQRLAVLCELYFKQPFINQPFGSAIDCEFNGDVSFNESAIISTGDDCEDGWVTGYAEGVSGGEYGSEVMGMSFHAELEPTIKRMVFGDLALVGLQGEM